jgi:PAS domain S-box-containing protein
MHMTRLTQLQHARGPVVTLTCAALIAASSGRALADDFLPHAVCYLWDWKLLSVHAVSDFLIGASYVAISLTLGYLVHRARRDVPFHWMVLAFGTFIIACGITHFMELWTLWSARYWLSGHAKIVTAIASVATAFLLPPLVPQALSLIRAAKLSEDRQRKLETTHAELETLYGRIKELDRLKTQFFANVSHELRTPLALILGPAETLLTAPNVSDEQRRELGVIQANARLLLHHVNDLLDVAKLEAGKMGLGYAQLDVAELIRLTAGYFEVLAAERGIRYVVETPELALAQVDPDKLQRVLLNLLSNAFKFTPDGGTIRCTLTTDRDLTITVDDSGPGVAPALREAIFDRFRQGEGGPARRFGGTGLGLAIARDFVELHRGRIAVSDSALGGACFEVTLPSTAPPGALVQVTTGIPGRPEVAQLVLADVREQRAAPVGEGPPSSGPAVDSDAATVLVVEDNTDMRRFLVATLGAEYHVETAADGEEGLRRATALRPDLVLTDVMMPVMSGADLVRELRRVPELATVPIVLLSAKADDELRTQLLRDGAQDFVTKPVSIEELRARVANLIAVKRAGDLLRSELASQGTDVATLARELAARSRELRVAEQAAREQREWLRVTLASIGDAVMVTDTAGRLTFLNPVAERVSGWTSSEALGKPLEDVFRIVNEQTRATVESPVARVIREGTIVGLANHTVLVTKKGGEVPIDDSGAPIRDEDGRLIGVVLVFRDVTDRRRADQERRMALERERQARVEAEAAQRRLELLADASALLASSLDYETTLKSVARLAVPALADWCAVDMLGEDGRVARLVVIHADPDKHALARELQERYAPRVDAPHGIGRVVATGQSEFQPEIDYDEFMRMARDERHAAVVRELGLGSFLCVPISAGGGVRGAMSFVCQQGGRRFVPDDLALAEALARRAALAIENARLYREAEIANRAKDEFLATLSHELRTPLNALVGWTSMLRTGKLDPPTVERALDALERNTRAQVQLIDDLLDVSRIISGKLRLDVRPVELGAVVEAAVDATRPAATAKDIAIAVDVDPLAGPVPGDPDRLQQVVWNLLSNAIKFTPKGGRVRVQVEPIDSRVRLRVTDTGQGIAPEFLPFIFERFRQAESPTIRTHGGLGLGLAIVRHLVDLHGGTVRAESAGEGRGSTFTVELPVRAARLSPAEAPWAPRATGVTVTSAPPVLEGLRVLVVDDDPDARDLLSTILAQCHAGVTVTASVPEALAAWEQGTYDVLVSDIGLPGEDGYALIRAIRAREGHGRRIPAVALTAYARSEDRRLALLAGFQMHVAKPVQPDELIAVVAHLVAMRRT